MVAGHFSPAVPKVWPLQLLQQGRSVGGAAALLSLEQASQCGSGPLSSSLFPPLLCTPFPVLKDLAAPPSAMATGVVTVVVLYLS